MKLKPLSNKGQLSLGDAPTIVLIVGLTFLVLATFAFLASSYKTAIVAQTSSGSGSNSETAILFNGTSYTIKENSSAVTGINSVTTAGLTWINFDGLADLFTDDEEGINFSAGFDDSVFANNFTVSMWFLNRGNSLSGRFMIGNAEVTDVINKGWTASWVNNVLDIRNFNGTVNSNFPDLIDGATALPINEWTYLTITMNSTTLREFVNVTTGDNDNRVCGNPCSLDNSSNLGLFVGSYITGVLNSSTEFNGLIDELRIYNRVLSTAEQTEIFNSGRRANISLPTSGLRLWASFNENNGTVGGRRVIDKSPLGSNGTWVNSSTANAMYETDGTTRTLVNGTDYVVSGTSLTLLNKNFEFDKMTITYSTVAGGTGNNTASGILDDFLDEVSNNTPILGIVLTVSLIGIILTILVGLFIGLRFNRV